MAYYNIWYIINNNNNNNINNNNNKLYDFGGGVGVLKCPNLCDAHRLAATEKSNNNENNTN